LRNEGPCRHPLAAAAVAAPSWWAPAAVAAQSDCVDYVSDKRVD
jgi:hypothetical protein